jgi:hypothetical protein
MSASTGRAGARRAGALPGVVLLAAVLVPAGQSHAGILSADLQARLAQVQPGEPVAVIATLTRQIDPGAYPDDPAGLVAAEQRLADETQPEVIAAAGVPVTRFWITNAVAFSAPGDTISRVAALQSVAIVDLTPTAVAASPGSSLPTASGAGITPALTRVTVRTGRAGAGRTLLVSGVLDRVGRVRATLRRIGRPAGGRPALVRSAPGPGPFRLTLPLARLARGSYRLTVQATTPSGRTVGVPTTRRVRV